MLIHTLSTHCPLTKTISATTDGIHKTPYPLTWNFSSKDHRIHTIEELHALIKDTAKKGHCLIKGQLGRPLNNESRRGATNTEQATQWLVLDIDNMPASATVNGQTQLITPDFILHTLGLGDVSHVIQYSASHGLNPGTLSCHIFLLLTAAVPAPTLKRWLVQKNFSSPVFTQAMSLTRTGNALHWPLDVSACQNDKLIYVAPPVFDGMDDPMPQRLQLVKRALPAATLHVPSISTPEQNRLLTEERINHLRVLAGLPKRKFKYAFEGAIEYLKSPAEAEITEIKTERDFVYFNLNGGDSWAYYHPVSNPKYIYNFKGEPTYLTQELLPGYWASVQSSGANKGSGEQAQITYFAFQDELSSQYYGGNYDEASGQLSLHPFKNLRMLRDYALQNGIAWGDIVPTWRVVFDPGDIVRVDFANRVVNLFEPSPYMLDALDENLRVPKNPPPICHRIIHHALGADEANTRHFYHWLAYIVQNRTYTGTAWLLQGGNGTGKGLLANHILSPLMGASNVRLKRMDELNEQFNAFIEGALIVCIDEMEAKAIQFGKQKAVMANLKNYVTEPTLSIRGMYRAARNVPNYSNWLFFTNDRAALRLDENDRRWNVANYQEDRLLITSDEVEAIRKELPALYAWLYHQPTNEHTVRFPLDNEARRSLITNTRTTTELFMRALREGHMGWFVDQLPSDERHRTNALLHEKVRDYQTDLKTLLTRAKTRQGNYIATRDELHRLYNFITNERGTATAFAKTLTSHGLRVRSVRAPEHASPVQGVQITWKDESNFPSYLNSLPA